MNRKSIIHFASLYLPNAPYVMVYMLQQVEYDSHLFLSWVRRWPDYRKVMIRKKLALTTKCLALLILAYGLVVLTLTFCFYLVINRLYIFAASLLLLLPFVIIFVFYVSLKTGISLLVLKRRKIFQNAQVIIHEHPAVKIAVLGSFGKTTVKELLLTVLGDSKRVAATPGNSNVSISHARWITSKLDGTEEILVIEYGEFRPGDIAKMASMTKPDMALITGIAPNHLDNYSSYEELKADIASISKFVDSDNIFASKQTADEIGLENVRTYNDTNIAGWQISEKSNDLNGVRFVMKKDGKILKLHSKLLGEHIIQPIALVVAIADKLGLTGQQIVQSVANTVPYEHRMQPISVNGGWIIDDTYNGNIEGIRVGLELLKKLKANRKIYITPGLVEQGSRTTEVHQEIGKLIADSSPDKVILMKNSVYKIIQESLIKHRFKGVIEVEEDPLRFYKGLQYQIAFGDIVMMQNDWTDNYN